MNPNPDTPEPSAAHYRALIDRFNEAARAHNSGEIDFFDFRHLILQIDEEARALNLLRRLHRTCRSLARQDKNDKNDKRAKSDKTDKNPPPSSANN